MAIGGCEVSYCFLETKDFYGGTDPGNGLRNHKNRIRALTTETTQGLRMFSIVHTDSGLAQTGMVKRQRKSVVVCSY